MTPLGTTVKGATRWISIAGGFNIQPSEIAKVAVVFFVSYLMVKKADRIKAFRVGFVPPVAVAGVLSLMCVTQPDFGAATMIMGLTFVLMFIGGVRGIYIGGAGLTAAVAGAILVYSSPYRMERIMGFLNPEMDPQGVNYQINESLISIGSGGVWGVGLGNGKQKLFFLPDAHTDFIASIVGEELGLVGLTVLLLLFATIIVTGVTIARRSRTEYGTFLASGLTFYLAFQVLTNLQVIMSLLPTKGLALPFMSYGGSSLITNLFAVGVIMSVARECGRAPVKVADEPSRAGANRRLEVPEAPMDDEPEELE
jgi:cell division protein FtsW